MGLMGPIGLMGFIVARKPNGQLQTANCKPLTANCKPQTANRKPQTDNCQPATRSVFRPVAGGTHFYELRIEPAEYFYQVRLGGHHEVDVFVHAGDFVQAGA
jgi:hypothetical protein